MDDFFLCPKTSSLAKKIKLSELESYINSIKFLSDCHILFDIYKKSVYNKYRKWRNHKRGFAKKMCKLTSTRQSTDVSFFYLCSCLSTQFLYRTAVKATFNVKDNIKDIIKNSITLTINITTLPTKIRKIGGKTTSAYHHFLC